ncbi:MAG: acetate/propionate family kinase [Pseudomonadota bacterium]
MSADRRVVLAVNAGSSSLKFALYPCRGGHTQAAILSGVAEGLEPGGQPQVSLHAPASAAQPAPLASGDGDPFERALRRLRTLLDEHAGPVRLAAVAHRIVHGGERHAASIRLDDDALAYLDTLAPLAPLHQPHNLAAVRACRRAYPDVPQIGCFDTGFHASLPAEEQLFALPQALRAEGIRRYGFHGLSYRYLAARLATLTRRTGGRVLMAHLGNGASVCAMRAGRSIATSMGFSALDGLMMGTRSGAVDPGVLLYLLRQGWTPQRIENLLYRDSGLLGVSGLSADMRTLRASGTAAARQAIALFEHRLVQACGALTASLEGLDLLAFTGGIGEHDAAMRRDACARLRHLGVVLDPARNLAADGRAALPIHAAGSAVEVWVVPTDEGRVAAADAAALVDGGR